jgi:O-antigen/teichoic acid export membrane protein
LANYVVISGLGTFVAIAIAWLLPVDLYTWVFGQTFSILKETFCLISPAVLFLGLSAPIGHYLHAQNRFKALILSYGLSLLVLVVGWNGTSIALMSGKVSTGLMANVIHYLQAYMGKLMSVNVSFFVLLLSNYLQVRKDIKWQRMSFRMSDFNQDGLTN